MFRSSLLPANLVVAGLALVMGCGKAGPPPSAKCKGVVTYQGQPLAEAEIYFVSAQKGFSANASVNQGNYEITAGLPPASYKVFLTRPRITAPPMTGAPPPAAKEFLVPDKYLSETTSGLSADVKAGENTADFKVD